MAGVAIRAGLCCCLTPVASTPGRGTSVSKVPAPVPLHCSNGYVIHAASKPCWPTHLPCWRGQPRQPRFCGHFASCNSALLGRRCSQFIGRGSRRGASLCCVACTSASTHALHIPHIFAAVLEPRERAHGLLLPRCGEAALTPKSSNVARRAAQKSTLTRGASQ